jgi:hypothetical protein
MGDRKRTPLIDRVFARVSEGPAGCWLWSGATSKGYGVIGDGKYKVRATHRVVWEALVGPIPDGMELDHLCRVRNCCNPDHLEPVPPVENQRRGLVNQYKRRSHCSLGHEYTPENTYTSPTGTRYCRICKRRRNREDKAAKRLAAHC